MAEEGKKSADREEGEWTLVRRQPRQLPRDRPRPTRRLVATAEVLAEDAADDGERVADEEPDGKEEDDRGHGEGLGGVVGPAEAVLDGPDEEGGKGEQTAGEVDVPDPGRAAELFVEGGGSESSDAGSEGVEEDGDDVDESVSVDVDEVETADDENGDDDGEQLNSDAEDGGEEVWVGREAEDVGVDDLPAIVDSFVLLQLLPDGGGVVADEVGADDADEDEDDEAEQQCDEEGGVEDGQPVYLEGLREERRLFRQTASLRLVPLRLFPLHAVRELHVHLPSRLLQSHWRLPRHLHLRCDYLQTLPLLSPGLSNPEPLTFFPLYSKTKW